MDAALRPVVDAIQVPTDLLVAGVWRPAGSGRRLEVPDPATGSVLASVADADPSDAEAAVDAAAAAAAGWAATAPRSRADLLMRAFELMHDRSEELALLICLENGKSLADARSEVAYAAEFFRWYAEEGVRLRGQVGRSPSGANRLLVTYQPVGVSVLITPWNFPAAMATRKIAPALAAGCTTVLKPAAETPLTALAVAALLQEAGLPAGVLNVVTTSDPGPVVEAMLTDRRTRMLSFTGSTEVGRLLLRTAADNVLKCGMELGGNAPFVVLADADVDAALEGAMVAKMRNGGQACTAANRFFVQEPVHDAFVEGLVATDGRGPGRPRHRREHPVRSPHQRRGRPQGGPPGARRDRPGRPGHAGWPTGRRAGLLLPADRAGRRAAGRAGPARGGLRSGRPRRPLRARGGLLAMVNAPSSASSATCTPATSPAACGSPSASRAAWSGSTAGWCPTLPPPSAAPSRAASAARGAPKDSSSSWRPSTSRRPGDASRDVRPQHTQSKHHSNTVRNNSDTENDDTATPSGQASSTTSTQEAGEQMRYAKRAGRGSLPGRQVRLATAAILMATALAACGGGGDAADGGGGEAAAPRRRRPSPSSPTTR